MGRLGLCVGIEKLGSLGICVEGGGGGGGVD